MAALSKKVVVLEVYNCQPKPTDRETPQGAQSQYMTDPSESQANPDFPAWDADRVVGILSRERLVKYLHRASGAAAKALDLYAWNQKIGAALTVTLSQVEVCLRNSISHTLTDTFGPVWHRVPRLRYAHPAVQHELEKAEGRVDKLKPSLPDIVAASDFNLWRELCKPAYAGVFWGKRIRISFPHTSVPGGERGVLTEVHRRVDLLLKLRNRIAHHEPIIGSNWEPLGSKLADRHREATELLKWMAPDLACWVAARDEFDTAMVDRPAVT
jgi:hypothetical protein